MSKNFKRPVLGSAALAMLTLSSVSAFADGSPVSGTAGRKATFITFPKKVLSDGTLEIQPGKIEAGAGLYQSNTGSSGQVYRFSLEKNLILHGETVDKLANGNFDKFIKTATIDRGVGLSPHVNGEFQLRTDGEKNELEKFNVRVSAAEAFQRNRYLTANWMPKNDNVIKATNVTLLQVGAEFSEDKRMGTKTQAATIEPLAVSFDRAWKGTAHGTGVRLCGALVPVNMLAGKTEMAPHKDPAYNSDNNFAVDIADTSLCMGVGLGEKGGEIQIAGSNVVRMKHAHKVVLDAAGKESRDRDPVTQIDNSVSAVYRTPAFTNHKIRLDIGGEFRNVANPKSGLPNNHIMQATVGGAF